MLIGKRVVDFLFVISELFFTRCFRFVTVHVTDRRTDRWTARGYTALAKLQRGKDQSKSSLSESSE